MSEHTKSTQVELGALWYEADRSTGSISEAGGAKIRIRVVPNPDRSSDKHPTHLVQRESDNVKIGAFWQRQTADGRAYTNGEVTFGDTVVKVVVFPNKYKQPGTKQPDERILLSVPRGEQAPPPARPNPAHQPPEDDAPPITDADIPF